jgi:hypothetical protein
MAALSKLWPWGAARHYQKLAEDSCSRTAKSKSVISRFWHSVRRYGQRKRKIKDDESDSTLLLFEFLAGYNYIRNDDGSIEKVQAEHSRWVRIDTGAAANMIHKDEVDRMLSQVEEHKENRFIPSSETNWVKGYGGSMVQVVGTFTVQFNCVGHKLSKYPYLTFLVVDDAETRDYPILIGRTTLDKEKMISVTGPKGVNTQPPQPSFNGSELNKLVPFIAPVETTRNYHKKKTRKQYVHTGESP